MLSCIKTGFYARLPSGLYLHGDAFAINADGFRAEYGDEPREVRDSLLLRICALSDKRPPFLHITLTTYENWFDEHSGKNVATLGDVARIYGPNSTLIASPDQWKWLGYNGQPI